MLFQTNDYMMGINLWFTASKFPGLREKLTGNSNFENFTNELFFTKPSTLLQVPWSILAVELYVYDQDKPITLDSTIRTRLILGSYDPAILFNSVVKFYDIYFSPPDFNPVYQAYSGQIISCNRLNLDTFTINSMRIIGGNTTLLAIGV